MICKKCRKEIMLDSKFCIHCGEKTQTEFQKKIEYLEYTPKHQSKTKTDSKKNISCLGWFFIFFLIGLFYYIC